MHQLTHAFATSLITAKAAACIEDYEPVADAISTIMGSMSDEQKADLYALVQESVRQDMPFDKLTQALDRCLRKNEEHFR